MKQSGIEVNKVTRANIYTIVIRTAALLFVTFIFMISLDLLSNSFKLLGNDIVSHIINATSNPFISLFIGLLATAIVQSSSTVTSMIVAIVSSGTLTLEGAVPMVMGANIGTTVTSTIVSFAHIVSKKEFRKAFATATLHDLFNILVTIILFPLEYYFSLLSYLSRKVTGIILLTGINPGKIVKLTVTPIAEEISSLVNYNSILLLCFSVLLLAGSIKYLVVLFKNILIGDSHKKMEKYVFGTPVKSLLWGIGITGAIHSSSTTTSLAVPLVASNKLSVKKAFPFIIGANIGTTLTALIAAISKSEAALSIALAHVLFNVIGACIFFPVPAIRGIPVQLARKLGSLAIRNRLISFVYIVFTFFLIPFLLIYFTDPKPRNTKAKTVLQTPAKKDSQ